MKKLIRDARHQPPFAQKLIRDMIDAMRAGRDTLNILFPKMTEQRYTWLKDEGFEVSFNERTKEFEVKL